MRQSSLRPLFLVAAIALAGGCGKSQPQQPAPPPEVGVVSAKAESVPLTQDLVGRLSATRSADVRARVAGIMLKRVYVEGSDVKQGQVLFEIDPAPLRAALDVQLANLAASQATYANNRVAADRARVVGAKGLLSKSDVDNAIAVERTSAAAVQQAQASVATARINLGYANVTAPISGRSGQQQVTEGALVGQGEATLLTTVEQIDPIYVNFSQAVGQIDILRQAAAKGSVKLADQDKARVELLDQGGSPGGVVGALDFSDAAVDPSTGAVTLRALVPNPERRLLPGQYVKVRLTLGDLAQAWRVAEAAVQRDAQGAYVFVIGGDGKVVQKRITADTLKGNEWIVTDGLADGDQIVVSGVMKVKPGATAKAVALQPAAAGAPASAAAAAPADKH